MKHTSVTLAGVMALGLAVTSTGISGQDKFVRVNGDQAKAAADVASAAAKLNVLTFESTFQKEIRKVAPDYDNTTITIYGVPEMQITLLGRVEALLNQATQLLRNMEPVAAAKLQFADGALVFVSPLNVDAPDITDVVVTRDGKPIAALQKDLREREVAVTDQANRGLSKKVHEGGVLFPIEAFDPGARVVVDAVANSGKKYSKTLVDRDLRKLQ